MKVTVVLIFSLISLNILSEEYLCSIVLSEDVEMEIKTYERIGSVFRKTSLYGESVFQIRKETEEFIILNKTYNYPDIYTVFLDKKNKNIVEDYIVFEDHMTTTRTSGKCLIKN